MSNYNEEGLSDNSSSYNGDYVGGTALQIRLDTSNFLRKIEMYLRGQYDSFELDRDGNPVMVVRSVGRAKANDLGVQSIMSWITSFVNPQTVQGNTPTHIDLDIRIYNIANDFTEYLYINNRDFNISDKEINGIIDMIILNLQFFLSRTVGDGERKSYANTMRTTETTTNTTRGRGLSLPFVN